MRMVRASVLATVGALVLGMAQVLPAQATHPSGPAGPSSRPGSDLESNPTADEAVISVTSTLYHAGGWDTLPGTVFRISVTGGVATPERVTTTEDETPPFTVAVEGSAAAVRIRETVKPGLKLHRAGCQVVEPTSDEATSDEDSEDTVPTVGTLDGTTLKLTVEAGREYSCDFVTGAPRLPGATVLITESMDADGNLGDDPSDTSRGVGRQLRVRVSHGTANHALVTTDHRGAASVTVSAFGRVAITEIDQTDFLAADCWDVGGEDPIFTGYVEDGPTVAWDVEPEGVYMCQFTNRGIGAKGWPLNPEDLLPWTDMLAAPSPSRPGDEPLFLVLVAAGSMGYAASMWRSRRHLRAQQR